MTTLPIPSASRRRGRSLRICPYDWHCKSTTPNFVLKYTRLAKIWGIAAKKKREKTNSLFFCQIITSRRPKGPVRWPTYFFYTKYFFAIEGRRLACYMSITSSSSCFDSISLALTLIRRFADSRDSSLSMSSNTIRLCYANEPVSYRGGG